MATWEEYLQNQLNTDGIQFIWNMLPHSKVDLQKLVIPPAAFFTPLKVFFLNYQNEVKRIKAFNGLRLLKRQITTIFVFLKPSLILRFTMAYRFLINFIMFFILKKIPKTVQLLKKESKFLHDS